MKYLYHKLLKLFRKVYLRLFVRSKLPFLDIVDNLEESQRIIFNKLTSGTPCMIARFGSVELDNIVNYIGRTCFQGCVMKFVNNEAPEWWYNEESMFALCNNAGFFPVNDRNGVNNFCIRYIEDAKDIDILGSWQDNEKYLSRELVDAKKMLLKNLEPFFAISPWTLCLKGKKILVIHPFADTIKAQYQRRELLFRNKDILPEFASLKVIKAVQSIGGDSNGFVNWFEALVFMEKEMDGSDYEIVLIGCGAYGLPLAAHAKRMGKQAVHLGGALQLLFGIVGSRWFALQSPLYPIFKELKNDYWVNPSEEEKPTAAQCVEGACYW